MTKIVLMGGTGDLAVEKLLPALGQLCDDHDFDIIGTSRTDYGQEGYRSYLDDEVDAPSWRDLRGRVSFCQLDFYEDEDYTRLKERLAGEDTIFYLATLPMHYATVTESLASRGMLDDNKIAYEKPFGDDYDSARDLNDTVDEHVGEEHVYRVDHYLSKDLVDNLSVLRFANVFLEPVWNSIYIEQIQIVASEDFGVDDRAEYYDTQGALRDVIQSHLLQLLALIGMEEPEHLDAASIRDEKQKALRATEFADGVVGQYEGYPVDSDTETFAAVKADVDTERWEDVPMYLLTGKELEKKQTHIYVEFRNLPCKLFEDVCPLARNALVINIQPENAINLRMNTTGEDVETSMMSYKEPEQTAAYATVFTEILRGEQRSFVRYDEIEEMWRVVDEYDRSEPFTYERGSVPETAREFIADDGYSWHDI